MGSRKSIDFFIIYNIFACPVIDYILYYIFCPGGLIYYIIYSWGGAEKAGCAIPPIQQKEMEVYRMADNFLVAFAIGIIAYRE